MISPAVFSCLNVQNLEVSFACEKADDSKLIWLKMDSATLLFYDGVAETNTTSHHLRQRRLNVDEV